MPIIGTDAGEYLDGTFGNDVIYALGGDDNIQGTDGHDIIDGGDGFDSLAFYFHATNANLQQPNGPITYTLGANSLRGSWGSVDTSFSNVEIIRFSFQPNFAYDVFFDASGFVSADPASWIHVMTGSGDDTVFGSAYGDLLDVGSGSNIVDGGAGYDSVYVTSENSGAWVVASGTASQMTITEGSIALLTATNIERAAYQAQYSTVAQNVDASGLEGVAFIFYSSQSSDTFIGTAIDDIIVHTRNTGGSLDEYTGNGGADTYDFSNVGSFDGVTIKDFDFDDTMTFFVPWSFNRLAMSGDIHRGAFTGVAGELVYSWSQAKTWIAYDADGDGFADQQMALTGYVSLDSENIDSFGSIYLDTIGITATDLTVILTQQNDSFGGGSGNDFVRAGSGHDSIFGNAGNDILYGGIGYDLLSGGTGDDRLFGGDDDDILYGGEGNDIVLGGAGSDELYGEDGNDLLNGGAGQDILIGGAGDDIYVVDDPDEIIFDTAGNDTIRSEGLSIDLVHWSSIENAILLRGNVDALGNSLANRLTGSDGMNLLDGGDGNDILKGNAGADTLLGGNGADQLFGGAGVDVLTGGTGWDNFYFTALTDSSTGPVYADRITDFTQADGDHIILAGIDAIAGGADDAFTFIGTAGFSGTAGELRYRFDANHDTVVMMDVNGDGVVDMSIVLTGEIALTAGDFVL